MIALTKQNSFNFQLIKMIKDGLSNLNLALEKNRQRKQLLLLDEHLLKDIGITRAQAIAISKEKN